MRKASRILGIVGSSLAIVFGLMFIVMALIFGSLFESDFFAGDTEAFTIMKPMFTIYYVAGGLAIASAVPGFIAVALVTTKNTTAGVLNIIAAVLACTNTVSMVLFILAAVFAYKQEKAPPVMYVPIPPGAYPPPYPPYGAYPAPSVYPPPYPPNGNYPPFTQPGPAAGAYEPQPPPPDTKEEA